MSKENTFSCLGYEIFNGPLSSISLEGKTVISTINQYSYCIAREDDEFKWSLKESDILLPDGVGISMAYKLLEGGRIDKIAGDDMHTFLLKSLNERNGSCFYMGSSPTTLDKIKKRISNEYPNIAVGSYSPPFKPLFTDKENDDIIEAVNSFRPDVLFVGMTAPKQEKWSLAHKASLDTNVICSIGAVFDFYAGTVKRPSPLWVNLGLEWLVRLLKEPKRMWRRYIQYGFIFGKYMIVEKLKSL